MFYIRQFASFSCNLGFNVRRYDGKLLIKPQKEKVLTFCQKVGETIKKMATAKQISLFNGEPIETHHIVLVKDGGSDDIENLIHLHTACHKTACHKQEHSKTKFKAGSMA